MSFFMSWGVRISYGSEKPGWILSNLRNSSKKHVKLRRGNDRESLNMRRLAHSGIVTPAVQS